ncbi:hypothetical protein CEXT_808841 [Caerostris extrusa]|uniref:Uncharacterized protein n=1 Tax=Caerostris extrusa TaxID=172846 RepID=A0AAV4WZ25_CAEEX|nr:hypothetical protein CEXT_808841 [Caerostris extrusa]
MAFPPKACSNNGRSYLQKSSSSLLPVLSELAKANDEVSPIVLGNSLGSPKYYCLLYDDSDDIMSYR